jgi:hypothetical protein
VQRDLWRRAAIRNEESRKMTRKRDLVAYCGLYCGDCLARKGRVADMATRLRKELKDEKFERFAGAAADVPLFEPLKKYSEFSAVLDLLASSRCTRTCKEGAGQKCEVKICCTEKELEGCWECGDFVECEKLVFLEGVHGIAHIRNLRRLKRNGVTAFIEGRHDWYVKPPEKKSAKRTASRKKGPRKEARKKSASRKAPAKGASSKRK